MMAGVENLIEKPIHSWNLEPPEARALQARLSRRVVRQTRINFEDIETVAGVDIGYRNGSARAAVVVMNLTDLKILEEALAAKPVQFPYVPGLLSFREGPVILDALGKLKTAPDLLMIDGQGIAHPRRFGAASHIGVLLDMPSIGCAKTRLVGDYKPPQGLDRAPDGFKRQHPGDFKILPRLSPARTPAPSRPPVPQSIEIRLTTKVTKNTKNNIQIMILEPLRELRALRGKKMSLIHQLFYLVGFPRDVCR
jgi:deoxyinosine 3'endonuclease (endonuclease V)